MTGHSEQADGGAPPRRVRVVVTGRVQGVFFRASVGEVAASHRVTGWVRNREDGAVEAEVQGPPDAVDAVVAFCRTGPRAAQVDDVAVEPTEPVTDEDRFRVR